MLLLDISIFSAISFCLVGYVSFLRFIFSLFLTFYLCVLLCVILTTNSSDWLLLSNIQFPISARRHHHYLQKCMSTTATFCLFRPCSESGLFSPYKITDSENFIKVSQNPNKLAGDTQGLPTVPHNDFGGAKLRVAVCKSLPMCTPPAPQKTCFRNRRRRFTRIRILYTLGGCTMHIAQKKRAGGIVIRRRNWSSTQLILSCLHTNLETVTGELHNGR